MWIAVTDTPDVSMCICGDVAIGLLLASMEQIFTGDSYVCKGFWQKLGKVLPSLTR
jgi:lactate dehydrogenase-like 2-hydroxyacid dehydrogenase